MKKFAIAILRLPISHNAQSELTFRSKIEDRKSTIRQAGMALVVCLALIVLITAAVLAFFARATANRVVEASRSNRVEAEQLVKTAGDYVTSTFLQEIATNSTATTSNGQAIYQPTTNTFAIPQRPLPALLASDTNFANLIRRSVNETVSGVGEANASTHSTAVASRNGRTVSMNRWNAPRLLLGGGFTDSSQLPNWIYVNADGSATNVASTNAVGRFAYTVYDTSGLLDANVAGYPSGITGTNLAILKGTLAGADLSVIPPPSEIVATDFVAWRNASTATTESSYVAGVTNASTTGFLRAQQGDNRITSRQDLIKLASAGTYGITTNALPYLTHFSRAANAPSWAPRQNASAMPNYDASLATISPATAKDYSDNADNPTSVNRNIPNVRVTQSFLRRDGTTAQIGEPLINQRFPLSKMALVKDGATDPDIQDYFGLTWNAGLNGWDYRADTINTLDQVAAAGREPDFFELLKAGILDGSLGKSTLANTGVQNLNVDLNHDLQIFTVGANLIDQADSDDEPTAILRPILTETIFGIENHPYIYIISQTHFRRRDMGYTGPPYPYTDVNLVHDNMQPIVTAFAQFKVWNPNLNATANPGRTYRIRALQGETRVTIQGGWISPPVDQTDQVISFSGSLTFAEPVLLSPDNVLPAPATSPENILTTLGASLTGFCFGNLNAPNNLDGDAPLPTDTPSFSDLTNDSAILGSTGNLPFLSNDHFSTGRYAGVAYNEALIYQLEYSDGGNWNPVQRIYPMTGILGENLGQPQGGGWIKSDLWIETMLVYSGINFREMLLAWSKSDPRSQRFGIYGAVAPANAVPTMRPAANSDYATFSGGDSGVGSVNGNPGWQANYPFVLASGGGLAGRGYTPGSLADNRTDSQTYIADPDGVVRPADGTLATNILGAGSAARPVMLNRPLTSVGEMAYAMRGDPWKSLDFASAASADSALLDLFSVSPVPAIQAGVVNLNSAPVEVLQALLLAAGKNPSIATPNPPPVSLTSTSLTAADALTIAQAIQAYVRTNVIENRADLVRMAESVSPITDHKRQKEVIIRALADVSNIRTWNLMADIVSQIGSFPANSFSENQFIVQGEQRVWLHLAIDRPTAKVISKFSEPYHE